MVMEQILVSSTAALVLAGVVFAAEPASPLVSGAMNPVDEGDAAQLKAPAPDAAAEAKTEAMLKKEACSISGD